MNEPKIEPSPPPPPFLEAPLPPPPPSQWGIGRPGIAIEFEHDYVSKRGRGRLAPQELEGHPAVIRARNQDNNNCN